MNHIVATAVLLYLVMDPVGNIPFFIAEMSSVPTEKYRKVIFREACFALAILSVFLLCGKYILDLLRISSGSLGIAGGVVLFMIAIKMVFGKEEMHSSTKEEPFIVPLATPMIAGPSAAATIILVQGRPEATILSSFTGLLIAWSVTALILTFSLEIRNLLGNKFVKASARLMGLLLTAISIQMLIDGIKSSFALT